MDIDSYFTVYYVRATATLFLFTILSFSSALQISLYKIRYLVKGSVYSLRNCN